MVAFGRIVHHDPRSREYPARRLTQPRSVLWRHSAPVLDQGELSSCTGHALAQCLNTVFFAPARPKRRYLDSRGAVDLYSVATGIDEFGGTYPPVDTGSSSLGVCKAGIQFGYLSAYRHAFGFEEAVAALGVSPAIGGFSWREGMMQTDGAGFIRPIGNLIGGHEITLIGVNLVDRYVTILNSWGPSWGRNGRAKITFADFERLLGEQGDVTVPVPRSGE